MSDDQNTINQESAVRSVTPRARRLTLISLCLLGVMVLATAGFALMLLTSTPDETIMAKKAPDEKGYVVLFPENQEMLTALDDMNADDAANIEPAAGGEEEKVKPKVKPEIPAQVMYGDLNFRLPLPNEEEKN